MQAHNNGTAEALKRLHGQRSNSEAKSTLFLDGYTLTVEIRRFTPAQSKLILDHHNSRNRPLDKNIVTKYARLMALGLWQLNGETIIFGDDGLLITGQHRLHACVASGQEFYALVVTDVPTQVFSTCDRGKAKTNGQILGMRGETNGNTLSASIILIHALKTKQIGFASTNLNCRLEPAEMEAFLADHPRLRDSVSLSTTLKGLVSQSMLAAVHFLASEINPSQADAFFESLQTGANLSPGNPILALRERFIQNRGATSKLHTNYLFALTIKAWNAYRTGTNMKVLYLRTEGAIAEPFPTPI
jgi:hypothetical protein